MDESRHGTRRRRLVDLHHVRQGFLIDPLMVEKVQQEHILPVAQTILLQLLVKVTLAVPIDQSNDRSHIAWLQNRPSPAVGYNAHF